MRTTIARALRRGAWRRRGGAASERALPAAAPLRSEPRPPLRPASADTSPHTGTPLSRPTAFASARTRAGSLDLQSYQV
ncbi:hypothetical protein K1T71_002903 [Dendrolimus kikuchii]|uniref:Uncharacterized protein n=1 Tax=Dendrolimus kikuchii TaxID=765133 RepID=A0ACC1DED6_9NEOP|nr:hypothetical protein K1T71_002903 [Dendrolimus kikuchii]